MAEERRFGGNRFRKAVPSLPVNDCTEAVRYYCEMLGFSKDFGDAILGRDGMLFAGVSRGECAIIGGPAEPQAQLSAWSVRRRGGDVSR